MPGNNCLRPLAGVPWRDFRWGSATASVASVAPGVYQVLVGRSAAGLTHTLEVSL